MFWLIPSQIKLLCLQIIRVKSLIAIKFFIGLINPKVTISKIFNDY